MSTRSSHGESRKEQEPCPPGGAGEPEAHCGCLPEPHGIDADDIVHLGLAGNGGKRELPLSTCGGLDHDDDWKSGRGGGKNKVCSPVGGGQFLERREEVLFKFFID